MQAAVRRSPPPPLRRAGQAFAVRRSLFALLLVLPFRAGAQDTGWEITAFHADYVINTDRTIDVVERIEVDFGPLNKHGIYRDIITRYRRVVRGDLPIAAGTERVDLELGDVTDANGARLNTSTERTGNSRRIRIGDADVWVTGKQTYLIRYRLRRGIGFFDQHDELYWQVTGTDWPVPIARATATVTLPRRTATDSGGYQAWCYAGWAESTSNDRCTAEASPEGAFRFSSGRLDPGEGLTLVAGFPKGIVPPATGLDKLLEALKFWWPAALPLLTFVLMYQRWSRVGREPRTGSIVPNWRPPTDTPPGLAGTLLDQKAGMDDVVATMLDLAVRGFLVIREVPPKGLAGAVGEDSFLGKALKSLGLAEQDWEIAATDLPRGDLTRYEQLVASGVLDGHTSRKMSELHNEFYTHLPKIHKAMYQELVTRGFFPRSPDSTRNRYRLLGVPLLLLSPFVGLMLMNVLAGIGLALSGLIVIGFAGVMPAMTINGARRWVELKGLEEYIRRAEKLELEMRQAPKKTTQLFEQLLPYAVALGATDIWVKQFATVLASQPPTWYVGNSVTSFNVHNFSSSLSSFQTAATRTLGSSPGSSSGGGGGGSVGGGGGGGGGGSW